MAMGIISMAAGGRKNERFRRRNSSLPNGDTHPSDCGTGGGVIRMRADLAVALVTQTPRATGRTTRRVNVRLLTHPPRLRV
jgi:hypothetical protein